MHREHVLVVIRRGNPGRQQKQKKDDENKKSKDDKSSSHAAASNLVMEVEPDEVVDVKKFDDDFFSDEEIANYGKPGFYFLQIDDEDDIGCHPHFKENRITGTNIQYKNRILEIPAAYLGGYKRTLLETS